MRVRLRPVLDWQWRIWHERSAGVGVGDEVVLEAAHLVGKSLPLFVVDLLFLGRWFSWENMLHHKNKQKTQDSI